MLLISPRKSLGQTARRKTATSLAEIRETIAATEDTDHAADGIKITTGPRDVGTGALFHVVAGSGKKEGTAGSPSEESQDSRQGDSHTGNTDCGKVADSRIRHDSGQTTPTSAIKRES